MTVARIPTGQRLLLTAALAVPNQPALRNMQVAWHSVSFDAVHGFQTSNPSFALVH